MRPPGRPKRHHWLRWTLIVALLLVLVAVGLVAAAVGFVVTATHGMPSLAQLQAHVTARTTVLYDREGRPIARLHGAVNRTVVNSRQIPPWMKQATVAIEDKRFYHHHGVDFEALVRAALADARAGRAVQGASTITMQYIKNMYLGDQGGLTHKIREAVLAWQLEDRWNKDRILAAYLNTVYYGSGAYGVEAAARTYFHRNVWGLSLPQCALLAALPRLPSGYSPVYDPKDARVRRNLVLKLMAAQGYISARQQTIAGRGKLGVFRQPPSDLRSSAAYFVEYVTEQLVRRYGIRQTFEGGLKVYTSLDMRMQDDAVRALKSTLPPGPAGALVSIDPATGYIRAMAASTDWRTTKFNLAWQSRRQLGSAMKPFALAAALEQGINPKTTYYRSRPLHVFLGRGAVPPFWNVSTFSHSYVGRINLVHATWQSDNTVYAQLALDIGPRNIVRVAHKTGITSPLFAYPSIVLGTEVVNPLEVADAYATFANEGIRRTPVAIQKVVFPSGRVEDAKLVGRRAIPAGVAYVVDKILQGNTRYGTAAALPSYYSGVAAGKTGTTSSSVDAWFCGFNPKLATAVWMGYPHGEIPMWGVQGATYCVPLWGKYYQMVFGGQRIPEFVVPTRMPMWRPWRGRYSVARPSPSRPSSPRTN